MKYLENFSSYFEDNIGIFEMVDSDLLDLVLEDLYGENLIKCPCDQTKGWGHDHTSLSNIGKIDYKSCCSDFDKEYFLQQLINNLYSYTTQIRRKGKLETIGWYVSPDSPVKVTIKPTHHWFERLYRKSDEKYKNKTTVFNPTFDEAIEIIVKNIDKIINKVVSFKKNNFTLELIKSDAVSPDGKKVPYSVIVGVNLLDYGVYEFSLITHIKGERLYSRNYQSTKMVVDSFKYIDVENKLIKISKFGDSELTKQLCKLVEYDLKKII